MKTLSCLIVAFAVMFAAGAAQAANCYWEGGTSSDWGTAANWSGTVQVPGNDGAYFRSDKFSERFKTDAGRIRNLRNVQRRRRGP